MAPTAAPVVAGLIGPVNFVALSVSYQTRLLPVVAVAAVPAILISLAVTPSQYTKADFTIVGKVAVLIFTTIGVLALSQVVAVFI